MAFSDWMKNNYKWLIAAIVIPLTCAIVVPIYLSKSPNPPANINQTSNTTGDNNTSTQISNSPGATVVNNNIDPEALAQQLAKYLPNQKDSTAKDEEIKNLKDTIERLQEDTDNELKQLALQALTEDDTEKAVELMEKSAQSHTEKAAQDYIDIGNIAYLKNSQKALTAYEKAIYLDPSNSDAWNLLGHIKMRLGNLDEAQHAYEQVLEQAGENKVYQAIAYGNLGIIYKTRGELEKAEEYYLKALDINKKLGRLEGMANQYGNLGVIYKTRGELEKAEEYYLKALDINKKLGSKEIMAKLYGNVGNIYQTRGELEKAEEYHFKALNINKKLGRLEGMAIAYSNLGNIYKTRGELEKAEEYHFKALNIEKKLGRLEGMAIQYGNLGNIYKTRGELEKAEEYYFKSLDINKKLGRLEGMAIQYGNLGNIYQTRGELEKACNYWQQSFNLFTNVGAQDKIELIAGWITEECKEIE